jgi:hypothetical protein
LKGELLRREQLSAQAQQVDEADQKSLKVRHTLNRDFFCVQGCHFLPSVLRSCDL